MSCIEQEKYEASTHAKQQKNDEQCRAADAKWEAMVKQLRDDYVKQQREMDKEHARHNTEMEKQHAQQEQRHAEQQWRLHVSQSIMHSTALYSYSGYPSVQVCTPPPLLLQPLLLSLPPLLLQSQLAPPLPHPGIPLNVQPQVPVEDFVQ